MKGSEKSLFILSLFTLPSRLRFTSTSLYFSLFILSLFTLPFCSLRAQTETYDVAFDRTTERTRTDRMLNMIMLNDQVIGIPHPELMYNDLTPQYLVANPGQKVRPTFGYSGTWMQGYVYIDLNRNGRFDVKKPGASGRLQARNELMTFAGMTVSNGKYNSAGTELNNLSAVQPPAFVIPDTLSEGYYMMRWKVDWDWADPAGRMDATEDIIKNGGAISDVLLQVTNEPVSESYELIFSDEFDQPDGSRPDSKKWRSSTRYSATWNRWISNSPDVTFIRDGALVCRAIPNPNTSTDNVPMITGAMETRGKFSFTYGKVEVRLRTNLHTGNFPAAWMMPQPPADGWPNGGEIDIFESIDGENKAYHTVHSNWTYNLGHKNDPQSSFSEGVDVSQWHTYGLIWNETSIVWTLDGNVVGTYMKSSKQDALAQGQWPFTHPFYIILNQSVGNGTWAKPADISYTYETLFDWVRVYKKKEKTEEDGIRMMNERQWTMNQGSRSLANHQLSAINTFDLYGRRIGNRQPLKPGIYLVNGRKFVIR